MTKLLYRVEEACELTGLSQTKLHAEIKSGRLGAVYIGRLVRVPAEELEGYIKRLKDEATASWRGWRRSQLQVHLSARQARALLGEMDGRIVSQAELGSAIESLRTQLTWLQGF